MIVAGVELTTIVRKPSSRSTLSAWQPAWSNSHAWPITSGPDPLRQIDSRSVRLGMRAQLLDPVGDDRRAVVRAGTGLGVELRGARPELREVQTLDGAVVQGGVRHAVTVTRRDREAVVLRRHEHPAA